MHELMSVITLEVLLKEMPGSNFSTVKSNKNGF